MHQTKSVEIPSTVDFFKMMLSHMPCALLTQNSKSQISIFKNKYIKSPCHIAVKDLKKRRVGEIVEDNDPSRIYTWFNKKKLKLQTTKMKNKFVEKH